MNALTSTTTVKDAPVVAFLPTTDLRKFVARVRREKPEWTEERLAAAERDYRQFWLECKSIRQHRPPQDADEIWHAHILHTEDYHRDSHAYFGYYLHHRPDEEGEAKLKAARTCESCGNGCGEGGCNGVQAKADCADDGGPCLHVKANCQGGGDGCTACGSGCSGGGTIKTAKCDHAGCKGEILAK